MRPANGLIAHTVGVQTAAPSTAFKTGNQDYNYDR